MTSHRRKLGAPTLLGAAFHWAALSSHDFRLACHMYPYAGLLPGLHPWMNMPTAAHDQFPAQRFLPEGARADEDSYEHSSGIWNPVLTAVRPW
jgi:hypothetical protein